jgi:hypothetical protein
MQQNVKRVCRYQRGNYKSMDRQYISQKNKQCSTKWLVDLGLWCLTPLSTIDDLQNITKKTKYRATKYNGFYYYSNKTTTSE